VSGSVVRLRSAAALPLIGVALVAAVLGVQLAGGGGSFTPVVPASACAVRDVTSVSTGIDGITERVVLLGLDRTACRLGTTREALVLRLAQSSEHTDAQVAALRAGLLGAVDLMEADRTLPPAAELVDDAVGRSDLNGFLKVAIAALPPSVVNGALNTVVVLRGTIDGLDLRTVLANLANPDELTQQMRAAVTTAVEQALLARLRGLV
jgi:hypothetical protein